MILHIFNESVLDQRNAGIEVRKALTELSANILTGTFFQSSVHSQMILVFYSIITNASKLAVITLV